MDVRLGDSKFYPDFIAQKGDSIIVFEVKTGRVGTAAVQQVKMMAEAINRECPKAKFRLVAVNYPETFEIDIDDIDAILTDYFVSNFLPSELDELSPHTTIDEVIDVQVNSVKISPDEIELSCEGKIVAQLDYDIGYLKIDTSEFYE